MLRKKTDQTNVILCLPRLYALEGSSALFIGMRVCAGADTDYGHIDACCVTLPTHGLTPHKYPSLLSTELRSPRVDPDIAVIWGNSARACIMQCEGRMRIGKRWHWKDRE